MRSGLAKFLAVAVVALVAACAVPPAPGMQGASLERRVFPNVNFDFDSYRIRPSDYGQLDQVAVALNDPALGGLRFEINGHTDVVGRLGYNISLSQLRATEVVNYLASRGVPAGRMQAQGFGPLQLLDSSNPRSPVNRRVEIAATP